MNKILTLVISMLITTTAANAISLRYKFKVFSSGPNIYACNAGIIPQSTNKQVCYFQGTNNVCNPDDCSTTGTNCNSSCICSGANGGDYLMNFGVVSYQDWKDNGDTSVSGSVVGQTFTANNAGAWSQALSDSNSWGKRITDLSFNLGTELYTARYFVDICYRGPQMEYFENNIAANFSLNTQSFATDFLSVSPNPGENDRTGLVIPGTVDGKKYTELSGLKVQSFVACDMQGLGTLKFARNAANQYNTADNEAVFNLGAGLLPVGATEGANSYWSSTSKSVSGSVADLISAYITSNSGKTPRFCKIRYVFTETDWSNTLPNLRKWQRHGAEMCTYTKIEEDAAN